MCPQIVDQFGGEENRWRWHRGIADREQVTCRHSCQSIHMGENPAMDDMFPGGRVSCHFIIETFAARAIELQHEVGKG